MSAEFVRVAEFEADEAAVQALVAAVQAEAGPPAGVPATSINILRSMESDKLRVAVFFKTAEDLETGSRALDEMTPPEGSNMRRTSVEAFRLVLSRDVS